MHGNFEGINPFVPLWYACGCESKTWHCTVALLTDFRKSFIATLGSEFEHVERVATLPREIFGTFFHLVADGQVFCSTLYICLAGS